MVHGASSPVQYDDPAASPAHDLMVHRPVTFMTSLADSVASQISLAWDVITLMPTSDPTACWVRQRLLEVLQACHAVMGPMLEDETITAAYFAEDAARAAGHPTADAA